MAPPDDQRVNRPEVPAQFQVEAWLPLSCAVLLNYCAV